LKLFRALVDNDQAEVRVGEHRAARPDDDLDLAARDPPPVIAALCMCKWLCSTATSPQRPGTRESSAASG